MNDDDLKDDKSCDVEEGCSPCDKGTNNLLLGSGVGAYGAAIFVTTGAVCPTCVVLAPALLGYGAYKRYKFSKKKKSIESDS